MSYYELAVAEGANVVLGGGVPDMPDHLAGGAWVQPTIWTGLADDARVVNEEIFGPCCHIRPFDAEEEAVALANDTTYGLSAAVFGADMAQAEAVARRLNAGAVSINDGGLTVEVFDAEHTSFNFSGLGASRCGRPGLERFFRQKALMIRHGEARGVDSINEANAPS